MSERRCTQCFRWKPEAAFVGARGGLIAWCQACRALYRSGGRRTPAELRGKLGASPDARPRIIAKLSSQNRKLGGIPTTISSAETCPDACGLKGDGCYAEHGLMAFHWRKAAERGLSWAAFLRWVRALPAGQLWRHNTAGDLAGAGDLLDVRALDELVEAARATRGFTFTHYPLATSAEREAVAAANDGGFTVNLSADSLVEADAKLALGVAPVVSLVPPGTRTGDRTKGGAAIVVCPAQLHDRVTCRDCGLCRNAYRRGVVGFLPHGQLGASIARRLPVLQRASLIAAPAA